MSSIAGPWITEKEVEYVSDAARNGWYENATLYRDRFESAFSEYVGRRYAITLPSCTSGLHLSLLTLGVGSGDEVIVPEITWIATAAPIVYVGATPVFADVDPESWCITAAAIEEARTPRTKAVIVVDLYGNMPDMDPILALGLPVIEDAASAIGAVYDGRMAGSFGDISVFSFHGSKTLTTGEGGMLVTDYEEIYRKCLFLRDHGREPGDHTFRNTEVAYKYKMSDIQAALGLAQLERIDELVGRKRRIFGWYRDRLDGRMNSEAPNVFNTYWMTTVLLDRFEELRDRMDCRPMFHPLSSLPAFSWLPTRRLNPVAYGLRGINLPSSLNMTEEDVEVVVRCLS